MPGPGGITPATWETKGGKLQVQGTRPAWATWEDSASK